MVISLTALCAFALGYLLQVIVRLKFTPGEDGSSKKKRNLAIASQIFIGVGYAFLALDYATRDDVTEANLNLNLVALFVGVVLGLVLGDIKNKSLKNRKNNQID